MSMDTYSDQPRYRDDPSAKEAMSDTEKATLTAEYKCLGTSEDAETSPINKRRRGFIKGSRSCFGDNSSRSVCARASLVALKVVVFVALLGYFVRGSFHGFKKQCTHSKQKDQVSNNDWHDHGPSDKRDISVNTTTNSIVGKFPLYDSLNLTTVTGSIAVVIDPQPAHPEQPDKPARVSIRTESGSISVSFRLPVLRPALSDASSFTKLRELYNSRKSRNKNDKTNNVHAFLTPRPYEVEIHTASGSISGQVAFSNLLKISTISGSISANLIPIVFIEEEEEKPPRDPHDPYHPPNDGGDDRGPQHRANVSIFTSTETGSTHLSLLEPFFPPPPEGEDEKSASTSGPPEKGRWAPQSITAHHIARGSGSVAVVYPPSWAGRVHAATSGKGRVSIGGEGVLVRGGNKTVADGVRYPDPEAEWDALWWGASGKMNVTVTSDGGIVDFFARGNRIDG
ncbi:hypothetical protein PAAG_01823 [Paracoccidioides lutzii Pb01]|uniref:Uncharacterized protein n=1 Tax=Paracoccidioides lutzii (strain ATCC MYA-826 / Pb01) TaxID=502779 RepID=C1GTH8_PARBA|nr:hypothetical protein PAAG_01823 [Paracoccidioides lutzii Pb01]EEH39634.1 hypothetical protein PAAG_01823 [Paracoccidioides lutzii Pb01]